MNNKKYLISILFCMFFCSFLSGQTINFKEEILVNDSLFVAKYDLKAELDWNQAKSFALKLGKGWRLPTLNELEILNDNKDKIGGFKNGYYWTSDEYGKKFAIIETLDDGLRYFNGGTLNGNKVIGGNYDRPDIKTAKHYVRLVRDKIKNQ